MSGSRSAVMIRGAVLTAAFSLAGLLLVLVGPGAHAARAAEDGLNACGCRQSAQGLCVCERKSKCGCPGECEPNGCEERRAKQMEKEIQAETRKAEEASRKHDRSQADSEDSGEDATPPKSSPARSAKAAAAAPKGAATPKSAAAPKSAGPKMTAAQKKDLARLLGLYLADHPNDGDRSIDQVRSEVSR